MFVKHAIVWGSCVGLAVAGASIVLGQDYPVKSVRIVTSGVGGSSDFMARLLTPGLTNSLGQPVIMDNRGAITAVETVAKAQPDGYTLLFYGNLIWIEALMKENALWDPIRDFAPITLVGSSPGMLVVHPSLPVKSVKDLIALAKARPGELNYAGTSIGGTVYFAVELFKSMAGVNIVHVPYQAMGAGINDLIGGQIQVTINTAGSVTPHVKSGRLRALAVTTERRTTLFPDLATIAETLPGYESVAINGLFAPAKTPVAIVNRISREAVQILGRADVKEKFHNAGIDVVGNSPEQFAAAVKADMARISRVLKEAGIRGK